MKTFSILILLVVGLAFDVSAQVQLREATAAEVTAGTIGLPAFVTPRRLRGSGGGPNTDMANAIAEFISRNVLSNLVVCLPLQPRFSPSASGRDILGNRYTLVGSAFDRYEGLVCWGTNSVSIPLPQRLTNYTVVWVANVNAEWYDANFANPAGYMNLLWSMTDTNTHSGVYFGADLRDSNKEMFLRQNTNGVWSATDNPAGTIANEVPQSPSSTTALRSVDVFQRGSVFAVTTSGGGKHDFYWNSVKMRWAGVSGGTGTLSFTNDNTYNGGVNMLRIAGGDATYQTNSWHGGLNPNWWGGYFSCVMVLNTTNEAAITAAYAAYCHLDGRPRTYIYGFSLLDPLWWLSTLDFVKPYDARRSTKFGNRYQMMFPSRVFQNVASAGGSLSNQISGQFAATFNQGFVTNAPRDITSTVITEGDRNYTSTVGSVVASNISTFYRPMSDYGASMTLLRLSNEGTNGPSGFVGVTNLSSVYDASLTNSFPWMKYVNAAQYIGQSQVITNNGPWAFSHDNIHWHGDKASNYVNGVITLIETGVWTGPGASNSTPIYP